MSATPMDPDAAAGGAHEPPPPRRLVVSAGQLGPIHRNESRASVVDRLIRLLEQAHSEGAELIAFPELALTTFFPRWHVEGDPELDLDSFYETEMPGPETKRLFARAAELEVGSASGTPSSPPMGVASTPRSLLNATVRSSARTTRSTCPVIVNMSRGGSSSTSNAATSNPVIRSTRGTRSVGSSGWPPVTTAAGRRPTGYSH